MKTIDEIKTEVTKLKDMQPKIPAKSFFGDDNHGAIDAQIEVLEEDMDEDAINAKEDSEDWSRYAAESARGAREWMDGESDDQPSGDWSCLVKEGK
ncbi:MAG TPA: hypothetical protein VG347_05065 [Verrucomicrobiae bacterium]|nr:hypothetical protein [Verrucomicrobiae bacterium]